MILLKKWAYYFCVIDPMFFIHFHIDEPVENQLIREIGSYSRKDNDIEIIGTRHLLTEMIKHKLGSWAK